MFKFILDRCYSSLRIDWACLKECNYLVLLVFFFGIFAHLKPPKYQKVFLHCPTARAVKRKIYKTQNLCPVHGNQSAKCVSLDLPTNHFLPKAVKWFEVCTNNLNFVTTSELRRAPQITPKHLQQIVPGNLKGNNSQVGATSIFTDLFWTERSPPRPSIAMYFYR